MQLSCNEQGAEQWEQMTTFLKDNVILSHAISSAKPGSRIWWSPCPTSYGGKICYKPSMTGHSDANGLGGLGFCKPSANVYVMLLWMSRDYTTKLFCLSFVTSFCWVSPGLFEFQLPSVKVTKVYYRYSGYNWVFWIALAWWSLQYVLSTWLTLFVMPCDRVWASKKLCAAQERTTCVFQLSFQMKSPRTQQIIYAIFGKTPPVPCHDLSWFVLGSPCPMPRPRQSARATACHISHALLDHDWSKDLNINQLF